jgi:hypothetical protein
MLMTKRQGIEKSCKLVGKQVETKQQASLNPKQVEAKARSQQIKITKFPSYQIKEINNNA